MMVLYCVNLHKEPGMVIFVLFFIIMLGNQISDMYTNVR